ncbi:uncharacterized protein LOC127258738 [Andrographis paniculata]|uniref:uncharacterized protein LOC127258738 n=1 Tax=Andrographis paniculata TaxID=175694 RepID=UPI0021E7AC2F|nr:uncharacterized protein LOC127258738 [Andrographis paniculata]
MSPAPRMAPVPDCPPPPPPPPSSPKILLFHRRRRTRRKQSRSSSTTRRSGHSPLLWGQKNPKGKLENLFDQENDECGSPTGTNRRERVEGGCCDDDGGGAVEEDRWRFQAEILRAECNFLRVEREFALKKLEKNTIQIETALRSAIHTLVSGRTKILEGEEADAVLVEEIQDLSEKLESLQIQKNSTIKDYRLPKCRNIDTKAALLQRQLQVLAIPDKSSIDVNLLRKNVDIFEDDKFPHLSARFSDKLFHQESILHGNGCFGRCKAIVHRIIEQVRAETEQWSQMQEMLRQVHGEMEELQASRDFWESRANDSHYEIQSLTHSVQEWKEKAFLHESAAQELSLEVSALRQELRMAKEMGSSCRVDIKNNRYGLGRNDGKERSEPTLSLGKQLAKEMKKRMRLHLLKENDNLSRKTNSGQRPSNAGNTRSPLMDIGNSSSSFASASILIQPLEA